MNRTILVTLIAILFLLATACKKKSDSFTGLHANIYSENWSAPSYSAIIDSFVLGGDSVQIDINGYDSSRVYGNGYENFVDLFIASGQTIRPGRYTTTNGMFSYIAYKGAWLAPTSGVVTITKVSGGYIQGSFEFYDMPISGQFNVPIK
jgi:hypothetical protein